MELKLSFIALTLLTNFFILFIGFKAITKSGIDLQKNKVNLLLGLILWQLFIYLVASTNSLQSYEFPPRFAGIFILPSFIFTGVFLYRNRNKKWIHSIPEHWIIYFQSFRILVELLFVFSLAEEIFNPEVTIEGYNFDMIFAFTAPIIAYLVYNKKIFSRGIILFWNYLGLCVLASVILLFLTSIYKPEIYGSGLPLLPLEAMTYPYVLIAGFLMPVAVFFHIFSILQIKKSKPAANTNYKIN